MICVKSGSGAGSMVTERRLNSRWLALPAVCRQKGGWEIWLLLLAGIGPKLPLNCPWQKLARGHATVTMNVQPNMH